MKSRAFVLAVIAGIAFLSSPSCGGKSGSSPSVVVTPTPTPQSIRTDLGVTSFNVRAGGSSAQNIDFPPIGTIDITVDWPDNNINIDVYATDANCPGFDSVTAGACPILGKGDSTTAKPERLSFATQTGKIYTIWTVNRGNTVEPVSLSVGITTLGPIPSPAAQPTPDPATSPTPRASATPSDLAPGPVAQVKAYVKSIDDGDFNYRPAEQDADGNWIVHPGEFVVFDMTQRNGAGLICNWIKDPEWTVDDPDGILLLKESSHPFFLRTVIEHKGHFELLGTIDGIESNVLRVESVANGT